MSARAPLSRAKLLPVLAAVVAAAAVLAPASAVAAGGWTWPVSGEVITPYRNGADPYAGGQHRGIDVAAAVGTPVLAATAGTVRFAGVAGSSGLTVSVRTGDGRFDTSYLHLSRTDVAEGERVARGERLGAVGTSGERSAAAPHLHFGVREAGSRHAYRDPLGLLPPPAAPPASERPRAPVPVGGPVRVAPEPAPVRTRSPARSRRPARAPRRVRVPAGGPVRVPGGAPAPAPAGRPVRVPAGGRAPLPRLGPLSTPGPAPAAARRPLPGAVRHPGRAPSAGPAGTRGPAPASAPEPRAAPAEGRRSGPRSAGGPDLGWLLACAGLLLAAACLGRPGDQGGERPRRISPGVLLRPLLGRR